MPLLEEFKYADITRKIIGCAMSAHSYSGNGFQEIIYQKALAYEFQQVPLEFERELEMEIFYFGEKSLKYKRLILTPNTK